jgi:DNA helicase-2/ATP-dependent DNA helicase PcrA
MSRLLENLNESQLEAVTTSEGPLLVIAGAGSGKTRVLTRRLAHILFERLAEPYQLLAVTFTNKAAQEMKERVNKLLGGEITSLNVSTFHSFCAKFLRKEGETLGFSSNFTIFDSSDTETLIKNCIKELSLSSSQFTPKAQKRKISDAKNKLISADDFAQSSSGYFENATSEIYNLYQRRLKECNAMDFDDLLFSTVLLLKNNQEIGERYRNRYKYILVDEYQDTNHVQYLLLKYLLGDHNNICVVGDEDQSIYGWRGADIRNILEFEKDYQGAKIIKLEQNYRSTNVILDAASAVIDNNEARKGKKLWTDQTGGEKLDLLYVDSAEDEAIEIINKIIHSNDDTPLNEIAVLYRTNAQSRPFEEQLRRNSLPYQIIGGITFYQRKEIKDLMAYLKLIANIKDDVSFERVINYPKRGVGSKTVEDIFICARDNNCSAYEAVKNINEYPQLAKRSARLQPFIDIIEKYRTEKSSMAIDLMTQDLVVDINMLDDLRNEDAVIGQTKIENIEAFIEGIAEFVRHNHDATLDEYLSEISLFTDVDAYREIDEKVTLMTLHAAKGLEFNTVYLVGLEEGLFPLARTISEPMELEEERRLFYVGATRAKRKLSVSCATSRHRFGEVESIPSRFIKELPEELINTKDRRTQRRFGTSRTPSFFSDRQATKKATDLGVHYEYEESEIMRTGRIVEHPTFGRGKIVRTEGMGESLTLDIMFTGVGMKKIMAKYAKLNIIG